MGQHFELLLPDPSEDVESLEATQTGESPRDYVQRVTALKLASALNRWRLRGLSLAPILWEIEAYLDSGEWDGKAGAYAIQGRAASHIAHIEGSYSGIMGLPVHETAELIKSPWKGL